VDLKKNVLQLSKFSCPVTEVIAHMTHRMGRSLVYHSSFGLV